MTHRPTAPASPPADGQTCSMFAVDIAGFTDRNEATQLYLHERLYEILPSAFGSAGIPWDDCFHHDRGDGTLIVLPPDISGKGLIDPLPERLRGLLRKHNCFHHDEAGIRLRAAAHTGPVHHDGHGFVGSDINLLCRMLDSQPLRRALDSSGADLAVIISDYLYCTVVCRHLLLASPDTFRPVRFRVKNTTAKAWTYLPGAPPPPGGYLQSTAPGSRNVPGKHALRPAPELSTARGRTRHLA